MIFEGLSRDPAHRERLMTALGIFVLAGAILLFVATGVLGVGRSAPPNYDFALYYAGGLIWLEGGNPYDIEQFAAVHGPLPNAYLTYSQFAYPPTFAPMAMLFAMMPFEVARGWLVAIDVVSIAVLAIFVAKLAVNAEESRPASTMAITPWLLAAFVIGNLFTSRQVWLGQITPFSMALLVTAWYIIREKRLVLAGVLLGLASIKPQLLILPMFWLLLERQWRVLFTAGAVAVLLSAYPFWLDGPLAVTADWLRTVAEYQVVDVNRLGHPTVVGFPGLLAALTGIEIPAVMALAVALAVTTGLWAARSRFHKDDVLGILLALHLGLVYAREYDLMYLAPAAAALWLHAGHRPRLWPWLAVLVALLFVPTRIMQPEAAPWLAQWLTPTTLLILGTLLVLSFRRPPGTHPTRLNSPLQSVADSPSERP
jgi:hypothetical protein